jgi:hypothetical protein
MVRATFGEFTGVRAAPRFLDPLPSTAVRVHTRLMTTPGEQWVAAIAARDSAGLESLLTHDIDFRGLTPRKAWEGTTPPEVNDIVLGTWFDGGVTIDDVEEVTTDAVGDTHRVGYRFRTTTADGPHLIEQQAYYRCDDDAISYLRVVCSGYRPVAS